MTAPPAALTTFRWRTRHVLFALLFIALPFVVYKFDWFVVDHSDPLWEYYFPVRWPLLVHALAGFIALFAGPFQFSTRVREANLARHRTLGTAYVVAVALGAPLGVYIALIHMKPAAGFATVAQAIGWFMTTAMAYVAARRRNIEVHRQWMVRSYVFTAIFITVRLVNIIPAIGALDDAPAASVQWAVIFGGLLLADIGLSWTGATRVRKQG